MKKGWVKSEKDEIRMEEEKKFLQTSLEREKNFKKENKISGCSSFT